MLFRSCHIWLKYLKASSGGTSSLDAAADDADVEMDRLADRLQGHDAGGWTRVIRPVVSVDLLLAKKWLPYLLLAVNNRRTHVSDETLARCEAAYAALAGLTSKAREMDQLILPVRFHHAAHHNDQAKTHRMAMEWAESKKVAGTGDAARFMLMNLQHLEMYHAPEEDGFFPQEDGVLRQEADTALIEALVLCAAYREILPEDYDLLVVQARLQRRTGNFAGCLESCAQAIALRPESYAAYCVRSNLRFLMEEFALALEDAQSACRLAPDKAQGFIARAFIMLHLGDYERSLSDFETAIRLDPRRLDAMHGKGKCLSLLGKDEEAMSCFNRLRRMLPDDPDIAYELADAMFAAGFLDDAMRVCQECLALDKTFTEAYVLMAVVETRRENDGLAFTHLERALEIEADNPFALNEMAYLLHLQGRDGEAFDYVEQALDSFPDFTEALYNKATILYFQGLLDESFDLYGRILEGIPDHVSALIGKANVLAQMSELDEALACYDAALKIYPKSSEACLGKATVYRMMGLEQDGQEWQEKARRLEQDPS